MFEVDVANAGVDVAPDDVVPDAPEVANGDDVTFTAARTKSKLHYHSKNILVLLQKVMDIIECKVLM